MDAITASLGGPDPTPPGPLPYADILNPQSLNKYQQGSAESRMSETLRLFLSVVQWVGGV